MHEKSVIGSLKALHSCMFLQQILCIEFVTQKTLKMYPIHYLYMTPAGHPVHAWVQAGVHPGGGRLLRDQVHQHQAPGGDHAQPRPAPGAGGGHHHPGAGPGTGAARHHRLPVQVGQLGVSI